MMIRPTSSTYRQHQNLHTRIPRRERSQTGPLTRQRAESAPTTPGFGFRLLSWLTGGKPPYQTAAAAKLIDAETLQRIEDLRTVLQNQSSRHGQLQLMVKDHLDIPPDMRPRQQVENQEQIFRNGTTEFFLNLEGIENLPPSISHKYCNQDDDSASFVMNDGISFMLPSNILPEAFKPNNKQDIKAWLGLNSNVDFKLWSNRRNTLL